MAAIVDAGPSRPGAAAGVPGPVPDTPLAALQVIDRLTVGPPSLSANHLTMPYQVERDGAVYATALTYRYEEPVFDPGAPGDRNLAAMIGVQVALNYGLFCREIVFQGPFDGHDRRFIADMMENTAREIYVLKFLQPNPFLTGPARELPVLRRRTYSQARVRFSDPEPDRIGPHWKAVAGRCAVSASGGKDSLLTHGIMAELGFEVHSIFGNESGRHWFTAVNAFRHFRRTSPHTGRVWMNSDRLFSWMLRHLPFVRPDFARVRSDEYPIRLWTVAVFLFGLLPLLRRRGIPWLLVGDEYDTTWPGEYKGITHYSGLYDQSRNFDDAMSDYYRRKGWGVAQFSILRPMAELLIMRTLARRYPELQAEQVSCHASHEDGGRMRPCGKCEKCRRIVAMLTAVGGDPARCGYTPEQVAAAIAELPRRTLHQESAGSRHLMWMLARQGVVNRDDFADGAIQKHPEILKLRFHPERSPVDGIPAELRVPLYGLLLGEAGGAVRYNGQEWVPFDPVGVSGPRRARAGEPQNRRRKM